MHARASLNQQQATTTATTITITYARSHKVQQLADGNCGQLIMVIVQCKRAKPLLAHLQCALSAIFFVCFKTQTYDNIASSYYTYLHRLWNDFSLTMDQCESRQPVLNSFWHYLVVQNILTFSTCLLPNIRSLGNLQTYIRRVWVAIMI